MSPNYPEKYLKAINCTWVLTNWKPGVSQIVLHLNDFETEKDADGVIISDEKGNVINEISGSSIPNDIHFGGKQLVITFLSDATNTSKGFSLNYDIYDYAFIDSF